MNDMSSHGIPQLYPLIAPDRLFAHPVKAAKRQDMERILTSPASEDYVTWNVMQLLSMMDGRRWWRGMLDLARAANPAIDLPFRENDLPALDLWRTCASPSDYERRSRERMATSENPEWRARAAKPEPVEGASEVDIVIEGREYLVFIEAKLGSDVSPSTTYDPERNQIARNIDVLLECAKGRKAYFWMLVRDRSPERAYVQIMQKYRDGGPAGQKPGVAAALRPEATGAAPEVAGGLSTPDSAGAPSTPGSARAAAGALQSALPHRNEADVSAVAGGLAILLWKDVLALIEGEYDAVLDELRGRCCVHDR